MAIAALLLAASTSSARAKGTSNGWRDPDGVGASAGESTDGTTRPTSGAPSGTGRRPSTTKPACHNESMSADDQATAARLSAAGLGPKAGPGAGKWMRRVCTGTAGDSGVIVWVSTRAPARRINPRDLAVTAARRAPVPNPAVVIVPLADRQVVGLEAQLRLDPSVLAPIKATASAGTVRATTTATPTTASWVLGTDQATCPATDMCRLTWTRSTAAEPDGTGLLTVTVTYLVTWSSTGVAGGGALPAITRSTSVPVRVAEIQSLGVPVGGS